MFTPRYVVRKATGGDPNVLTPEPVDFGWLVVGQIAYEISRGSAFGRPGDFFGVTICRWSEEHGTAYILHGISRAAETLEDAHEYTDELSERGAELLELDRFEDLEEAPK